MLRGRVLISKGRPLINGEVGGIVLYNVSKDKIISINKSEYNTSTYPNNNYIPIGTVAIPASHDVYGNGECGVVSLVHMSYYNPDNGAIVYSSYEDNYNSVLANGCLMYYGGDENILSYKKYKPIIAGNGPLDGVTINKKKVDSNEIIGAATNGVRLPSSAFKNLYHVPRSGYGLDTSAGYTADLYESGTVFFAPSPYLEDGTRNPSYYTNDTSKYPGLSANCLSDFDGYENTQAILKYATGQTDWKKANEINLSSANGYYPAACCCWRYHTSGTTQGEWYLPSAGEMGYVLARYDIISSNMNKLKRNVIMEELYWTSTQKSEYENICIAFGYTGYNTNMDNYDEHGYQNPVLAFIRL